MRSLLMVVAALLIGAQPALGQDMRGGWLGAKLVDLNKEDADALGWDETRAAKIEKLRPDGAAEKAGLQAGDVITAIDGVEVDSAKDLRRALRRKAPGNVVRLSMRRDGRERRLAVTLGEVPKRVAERAKRAWPQVMLDTGGHMALINDAVFTADGRSVVSASDDKTIRVWDLATGKTLRTIRGESEPGEPGKMFAMALSPDGKWLAAAGSASADCEKGCGDIRLFDFASGHLVALLNGHADVVLSLAFSPDGQRLISSSGDETAIIWDVAQRRALHQLEGHTASIYAAGFTPDGARVVTGSDDKTLRLWRVEDGKLIKTLSGHAGEIASLAVAPNGSIASGDRGGEIRLWDGKTGALRKTLARQSTAIGSMSISPDGKLLLTGGGPDGPDNDCNVFDLATGKKTLSYSGHDNIVVATAISPDGQWALTGGGDNAEMHIWNLKTGERRAAPDGKPLTLGGRSRPVWAVGFSADGQSLAWGNEWRGSPSLADRGPLQHVLTLPLTGDTIAPPRALGEAEAKSFNRVALTLGSSALKQRKGGSDGNVHENGILDISQNGRVVASIQRGATDGYAHTVYGFAPDGETIVSGGANGWMMAYDRKGKPLGNFIGHQGDLWAIAVSPDGRFLASGGSDHVLRLWNLKTRELLVTLFEGIDGEWVMWTPQGYYTGSPAGAEHVGWQINRGADMEADYATAAQLRKTFKRPDIVARAIQLASAEAAAKEAPGGNAGIQGILARSLPRLQLVSPATGATVRGGSAQLAFDLSATDDPVKLIRISVNGTQLRDLQPETGGGFKPGRIEATVALARGANDVTLVAINTEGYESEPLQLRLNHDGEGWLDKRGTLYLISIGVDAYPAIPGSFCTGTDGQPKGTCDLEYAGKDAAAFHNAMLAGLKPLHASVEERLLVNAPGKTAPTAEAIRDVLGILRRAEPNDTVAVFLSGHGFNEGRDYFLLPTDAEWSQEMGAFRHSKAVLWTEFQTAIQNARGRRILFMDTCHSGNSHAGALEDAAYHANIIAFYSARWDQLALEATKYGHGLFTQATIEGMRGKADANADQEVTTEELRRYLDKRVPELAAELKAQQNPQFFKARDAQTYPISRMR